MQAIARPLARVAPKHVRYTGSLSAWSAVPAGPPDPILGTWQLFLPRCAVYLPENHFVSIENPLYASCVQAGPWACPKTHRLLPHIPHITRLESLADGPLTAVPATRCH